MPGVLDADTHIAESEAMWSYIDKEMYPRRPVLARIPEDTWYHERNAFWLIDGEIFPKPAGKASFSLITPSAQKKESGSRRQFTQDFRAQRPRSTRRSRASRSSSSPR